METTPVLSPDQLNSPTAIADPYPFYRQLRDQSPVNYIHLPGGIFPGIDEPVRAWALMRYEEKPFDRKRILFAAGAHYQ